MREQKMQMGLAQRDAAFRLKRARQVWTSCLTESTVFADGRKRSSGKTVQGVDDMSRMGSRRLRMVCSAVSLRVSHVNKCIQAANVSPVDENGPFHCVHLRRRDVSSVTGTLSQGIGRVSCTEGYSRGDKGLPSACLLRKRNSSCRPSTIRQIREPRVPGHNTLFSVRWPRRCHWSLELSLGLDGGHIWSEQGHLYRTEFDRLQNFGLHSRNQQVMSTRVHSLTCSWADAAIQKISAMCSSPQLMSFTVLAVRHRWLTM